MDAAEAYDDLRRSHDVIADVTGTPPLLLRPPYGHLGGRCCTRRPGWTTGWCSGRCRWWSGSFPAIRSATPGGSWPMSDRDRSCSVTMWEYVDGWWHCVG
ncbi:hypothetical protein NKG94_43100 [Micromonospora sp. M12]